jgi:hypothetical protein
MFLVSSEPRWPKAARRFESQRMSHLRNARFPSPAAYRDTWPPQGTEHRMAYQWAQQTRGEHERHCDGVNAVRRIIRPLPAAPLAVRSRAAAIFFLILMAAMVVAAYFCLR